MYFVTFNTLVVIKMALWADSTRRHRIQWGMFIKDVWSLDVSIGCLSPECRAAPCPRAACWLPTAVTTLHSPRPRHSALRSPPRRHLVTRAGGNTEPPRAPNEGSPSPGWKSFHTMLNGCPFLVTFAMTSRFNFTSTFNACLCLA